jgi:hypothetical protein
MVPFCIAGRCAKGKDGKPLRKDAVYLNTPLPDERFHQRPPMFHPK